ncbi:hypothetical protein IHE45_19G011800 [Dioscorea alata]|uniref:Uncharacterized protein n=1 Tax=Dioscorea alata TaxID=55571 RepID=A0ACB7TWD4_DIOAL|nr:hypothetical protein IHE45_19G011800 [Dioscorea alata]
MASPKNGSNDKKYSSDSTDEYYNSEDPAKNDVINKPEEKKSKDGGLQISNKKRGCTSEETDNNPSKKNKVDDVGDVGSDVSGKESGGEDDLDIEDDQVDDKYGEEDAGSEDDQDDNNFGEEDDGSEDDQDDSNFGEEDDSDDSERTISD